jgi:hypothetical protein
MNEDEALDKFINDMLSDKNLSGVNDEARTYLVDDLKTRLLDQINRSIIAEMPEEKSDEFSNLLDNESVTDEQVQQFIVDSGVDTKKISARTMLAFRELYLQTPEERDALNPKQEA